MMNSTVATINLGNEYDEDVVRALQFALHASGAQKGEHSWGLGGSQEIDQHVVQIGEETVVVEFETYVGITITGKKSLVECLAEQVRRRIKQP